MYVNTCRHYLLTPPNQLLHLPLVLWNVKVDHFCNRVMHWNPVNLKIPYIYITLWEGGCAINTPEPIFTLYHTINPLPIQLVQQFVLIILTSKVQIDDSGSLCFMGRKYVWEKRRTTENFPTISPSNHFALPQMRRTTKELPTKLAPIPPNEEKGFSITIHL